MENELTLEQAFENLDEITKKMEGGSLSLEETFSLYKEALVLVEYCSKKIEKVESDIRILNEEGAGNE